MAKRTSEVSTIGAAQENKRQALAKWDRAKVEHPFDLVQLDEARNVLVEAEIQHEREKKKDEWLSHNKNTEGIDEEPFNAEEFERTWQAREAELRKMVDDKYQMPSLLENLPLRIPEPYSFSLEYVDDGNRVSRIVENLEKSLKECCGASTNDSLSNIRAEIITGHSGVGKTRLTSEATKAFCESVSPGTRIAVHLNLADHSIRQAIIQQHKNALDILADIFAIELFKMCSDEYNVNWGIISRLIKRHLPQLQVIVLVVDHFNPQLEVSRLLISVCGSLNTTTLSNAFYVLPIFVGTRSHLDMASPNGMATNVTRMTSLSNEAREAIAKSLAMEIDVPVLRLKESLQPMLDACGGWPSCFETLWSILKVFLDEDALQSIRNFGKMDATLNKKIWDVFVGRLSVEINVLRFVHLISDNMAEAPRDFHAVFILPRLGELVLKRLITTAMAGTDVVLDRPVLHPRRDKLEKDDPCNMTYRQTGSIVEIQPNPNNNKVGKVVMPAVVIAAANKSLGLESGIPPATNNS